MIDSSVKDGICYMCSTSCAMKIQVSEGKAVKIYRAEEEFAVACPRWKSQLDFIYHPDRLKYPLKRVGERGEGNYKRISWNEALDTIAFNLEKFKEAGRPEEVAFWIAYTKEPRPYFQRLTHAFGSPNYCTESSSCATAARTAAVITFGPEYSAFNAMNGKMGRETKCKIIWGSTIQNSAPAIWPKYLDARKKGLKIIVVDPRRTRTAEMADIHLQLRPGTDGALALGLLNVIINENLYDKQFVEKWTSGFVELKTLVQDYPPETVEKITRVPASKIREAAAMFAANKPAQIAMSNVSTTHHTNGFQSHRAIIMLLALTGNIDVEGGSKRGPKSVPVNDITLFEKTKKMPPGVGTKQFPIWTTIIKEMQSNALAEQIDSSDPYPIKALFAAGLDIQFFPNSKRLTNSLKKLDFIADTEYFLTPGAQLADIVLPIASWLERPILIAGEHSIKYVQPAIEPVGECRPEFEIYAELARRLGFGEEFWNGNFDKCADYILEPLKITCADLKLHPEGIPRPAVKLPERSYEPGGFRTASGKVEIHSSVMEKHGYNPLPVYAEPAESPVSQPEIAKKYPLVLTTGPRQLGYTHSQHRNIARLRRAMPDPLIEINPLDAGPRKIASGDDVIVTSPRGTVKMKASVTDTVLSGVVSAPHHWPGEANINLLVNDVTLDPVSGFPPFKSQLCQVKKA